MSVNEFLLRLKSHKPNKTQKVHPEALVLSQRLQELCKEWPTYGEAEEDQREKSV